MDMVLGGLTAVADWLEDGCPELDGPGDGEWFDLKIWDGGS